MKLYYSPGACSLAPHISLNEGKLQFDLEKVDLKSKKTDSGEDFLKINPKGYVPALVLGDNKILTEAAVVLQFIADKSTQKIAPDEGTFEHYRFKEWLNFISSELHKGVGFFFRKNISDEVKNESIQILDKRFKFLEDNLSKNTYLMGEMFTAADAYLFTILRWAYYFKLNVANWPAVEKYFENVKSRPMVQKALEEENLK